MYLILYRARPRQSGATVVFPGPEIRTDSVDSIP